MRELPLSVTLGCAEQLWVWDGTIFSSTQHIIEKNVPRKTIFVDKEEDYKLKIDLCTVKIICWENREYNIVYTVEPVRSDTWVFRHPVTSDKNSRSQNISLPFFVKKNLEYSDTCHFQHPTVLWSQCY
jgi:hypothetical protein